MSTIQVNGFVAPSAFFRPALRTTLSASFYHSLRISHPTRQLVTSIIPGYGQFSVLMECEVDPAADHDVTLGLEWAAHIRDFVLGLGFRIDDKFDAWLFLSDSHHPLGFGPSLGSSSSASSSGVLPTVHSTPIPTLVESPSRPVMSGTPSGTATFASIPTLVDPSRSVMSATPSGSNHARIPTPPPLNYEL
ncbi:hypothetical protein C8F04DRAFT_1390272 [Mycena alexandri]|uniref:Uncharacterized protein n=1 Tax=Mycena alexandri TaxID=1745969 RepID=A0AAD6TB46_9AGAR|nr:hypothetical protein C8F04DRAFT_1390272 [Mycena alexandri]